ncbi:restriction endonuclease subunit S [Streptococcus ruminantium]|uniref:restriction endonuclease subunit S n=1 Tax=Streptococcus ruminantium TaxID=1917441 RepID=UPI001D153E21|nr:restriction endonuclease subunit S [Streptococcus ruminantium]BDD38067.1 hypothetical protein GUT183_03050 [Streptococcus ruminantium]
MTLTKLGKYIETYDERNQDRLGADSVVGISTSKEFIATKAMLDGVNLNSYKVVPPKMFAYVADTSRRGEKISLSYNSSEQEYLVSSISTVFRVIEENSLNPEFLFIYFNRPEFDRFSRYNSWGSARETFSWNDMCDIEIDLPPLDIQEKYVAVYQAMLANQKAYENGLEDLKLVCDATIEKLRREMPSEAIGQYIEQIDRRNSDGSIKLAQGVSVDLEFIDAKRVAENFKSGKIVHNGEFAYNKVMKANGTKFPIALRKGETCFISGSYQVFKVSDESKLISEYLMMWLSRPEIQRYAGYISWGSTRDILQWEILGEIEISIPDIHVQQSIVDIYKAYITRKEINEKLKQQIKDLCPILIAGAIKEARANG